jgi:hypothetical protein
LKLPLVLVGCIALFIALGCGPADGLVDIGGTVKLDGKPIDNGSISFEPVDGKSPTAGATIASGAYKVRVSSGKMKVKISAAKVVGKRKAYDTPDSPQVDVTEDAVPPKYNIATELTSDISKPTNNLDFDLKGKP